MISTEQTPVRYPLGTLLLLLALSAFGGGIFGMAGAPGMPAGLLHHSPFTGYHLPGLLLFVIIGGGSLVGAVAVLSRHRDADRIAEVAGVMLLGWLLAEELWLGYQSWLQPLTALAGVVVLVLAVRLGKASS